MSSTHPNAARLAISIVLYQPDVVRFADTLQTLARAISVAHGTGQLGEAEVLLADHSPQAVSKERLTRWQAAVPDLEVAYRHDPSNPGFGAGHNATFRRAAQTDFFLVANPDIEFAPDSLLAGLDFFAAHPGIGVLAPALIEADGLRPACFRPPDVLTLLLRGLGATAGNSRRIARYECRDWNAAQPVFNPPLMSGCCLLFRREAYLRLGGFDPRYFLYFEDFDLSRRAARQGLSAYCPAMRVRHAGGGAGRKGWRHRLWFLRSAWRYHSTST